MTPSPLGDGVLQSLGRLAAPAEAIAEALVEQAVPARTFARDHTVWRRDPSEIADRLGWLDVVDTIGAPLVELARRCTALAAGRDRVLVMGMGGSSLFPEVLARSFEPAPGRPRLVVLDTTDPRTIAVRPGSARQLERSTWPRRSRARRSRPGATWSGRWLEAGTKAASRW